VLHGDFEPAGEAHFREVGGGQGRTAAPVA
jgi:hypothetical protein